MTLVQDTLASAPFVRPVIVTSPWMQGYEDAWPDPTTGFFSIDLPVNLAGQYYTLLYPDGSQRNIVVPTGAGPFNVNAILLYGNTPGSSTPSPFLGTEALVDLGTKSLGTFLADLSKGSAFKLTITGSVIITFSNWPPGSLLQSAVILVTVGAPGATLAITNNRGPFGANQLSNAPSGNGNVFEALCRSYDNGANVFVDLGTQNPA